MRTKPGDIVVSAFVLGVLLSAGCLSLDTADTFEASITTDRDTYRFGEAMQLRVIVNTSQSMDNVTVSGSGLVSSKGPQLWLGPVTDDLISGTNIFNFSKVVPQCSDCTKLSPGVYNITASVNHDGERLATVSCNVTLTR